MYAVAFAGLALVALFPGTVLARKNIFCYYGSWAFYRKDAGKFTVQDIDPLACTHLVYSFVGINANGTVAVLDPWLDLEDNGGMGNMRKFNDLKKWNCMLKTLVAVGGWNEGSKKFSTVAQDPALRTRFATSAVDFCKQYSFDGMDLDWEYPAQRDGNPAVDRANFVLLLADLRKEFTKQGLLLTAAVAAPASSANISYDIPEISKHLDMINIMMYDFHGPWENFTGNVAPLYGSPDETTVAQQELNVNSSLSYWLEQGAPAAKINMGLPFYGKSFTLASTAVHGVGANTSGPGEAGPYTGEPGTLGYNEICEMFAKKDWTRVWDDDRKVPYAYSGDQWVGYDNATSILLKVNLINQHDLAGAMVWSIETDDFHGNCGDKFILLKTLKQSLH